MLRNYFKIAIRNLLKNKVFSFINIAGLAVGMAVSMLIGLWIHHEFSYENFHQNRNQLYRVLVNGTANGDKWTMNSVCLPLANKLRREIPEIKLVAESNWEWTDGIKVGEKKFIKEGTDVSPEFFSMFRFKFLQGNHKTAFNNPESVILTAETAKALFGDEDPMGKIVRKGNKYDLKVTGVIEDMPTNTYFKNLRFFTPFSHYEKRQKWVAEARTASWGWKSYSFQMYVELNPNVDYAQVEPKIRNLIKKNSDEKHEVMFYPLARWRLYNKFDNWKEKGGRIEYVQIFGVIGFLVLLIACINFMNLSTARSEKRAREVGVRKSVGSNRSNLVFQFLGESLLISSLAMGVALLLVGLVLPAFNQLIDGTLAIPFSNLLFWGAIVGIVILTGLLAGSYPAFYLSSFSAIRILKGTFKAGKSATLPRKILVTTQFVASIALIISTMVIYQQIQHAQDRPSGYNPKGLMMVDISSDLSKNYNVLKNELLSSGVIENVTKASSPINAIYSNWHIEDFPGKQPKEEMSASYIATVPEYFSTVGTKIVAGRDFNKGNLKADSLSVIINEAAVKRMRLKSPIGQYLKVDSKRVEIIGIVENAVMTNPFEPVGPTLFRCDPDWANSIMFRLRRNAKPSEVIAKIAPLFAKLNPAFPFEYFFADDEYGKKFSFELMVGKLSGVFALLAIFISCLGLFGLSAFVAEQRTKEIGIRKVLGANVMQLWVMLSTDFVVLVAIACVIASPIALYFLQDWLQKYDYRIELDSICSSGGYGYFDNFIYGQFSSH